MRYAHSVSGDFGRKKVYARGMGDLLQTIESAGQQALNQLPGVAETALQQQLMNDPAVQAQLQAQAQEQALKQTAAAQLSALQKLQTAYAKNKTYLLIGGGLLASFILYRAFLRKK